MKKDYFVRPYRPGDEKEIVQLLQLVFNGWPRFDIKCSPLDHWKWKFKDNPLKSSIICVAISNGEIIGCSHKITTRLKIGNSVFLCSSAVDSATHPNFRRIGVYKEMSELGKTLMAKSKIKLSYRVTGNPILIKHYSNYHNLFTAVIYKFVRIQDIDWHLQMIHIQNARLYKYSFHLVKLFNKFRNTLTPSVSSNQDFYITKIHSFDDNINPLWDKIRDHYTFIVERTKKYLNWRYCDPRGGDYLLKIAEIDGQVLGYIVLRINKYKKDYPVGYIVDLLTLPDRLDVANALVREAIHYFDDQNINIIKYPVIKNHPHERTFKKYGFLNRRQRIHVFCVPHTITDEKLRNFQTASASKVHFEYGDFDEI